MGIWRYENIVTSRSYRFDVRDPCHPEWLSATVAQTLPGDAAIQHKLAGTWWHSQSAQYRDNKLVMYLSRSVVASNGDYSAHVTHLDGTVHSTAIQGHWRVRNGVLFDTITNYHSSVANQRVLYVFTNQILRVSDRELIFRDCSRDDDVELFRRASKSTDGS